MIASYTALPRAVQNFRSIHPDVMVELLAEVNSRAVEAALDRGELDLGILHPPLVERRPATDGHEGMRPASRSVQDGATIAGSTASSAFQILQGRTATFTHAKHNGPVAGLLTANLSALD